MNQDFFNQAKEDGTRLVHAEGSALAGTANASYQNQKLQGKRVKEKGEGGRDRNVNTCFHPGATQQYANKAGEVAGQGHKTCPNNVLTGMLGLH